MKRTWRRFAPALAALVLALALCPTALAAGPESEPEVQTVPAVAPVTSAVYPAEVRETEENGVHRIEKVYYLTRRDDPAAIPTGDFQREGRTYTLLDVLKNDQSETDSKDHIEVVSVNSSTDNLTEIIQQLEPALEVTTEDGYSGVLAPDYPGIKVEAAGYKTSSRTVTASRSYPNLSDADASLIPKTISDGGRTLILADVQWQEAGGYYNASATYSGTATGKYATGYNVTVEYKGEVTRTRSDSVIYTAVFASHGETQIGKDDAGTGGAEQTESGGAGKAVLLIPLAALLGGACFGGWKLTKYYKNKKRGYV
ncbi:hypothetical protein [uncultured Oscillibacter sp.]|uniref:hypothetical protein n=1 Tax=uncultured Oscillibacter sp. TaxID=876091 RepID=UPI00260B3D16|nr:hypothetical protein [uncultured Oscillibacter sp.]